VQKSGNELRSALGAQYNRVIVAVAFLLLLPIVVIGERVRTGSGRRLLRWGGSIVATLCSIRFDVRGRSAEDRMGTVVVPSHSSLLDIPALLWAGSDVRFVATAGLFRIPMLAAAMRAVGTMPIDRHDHDGAQHQLDKLVGQLDLVAGADVAIFAEVGIAPAGQRRPFETDAFSLAIRTGRPVVPVAIRGSDRLLHPGVAFWCGPAWLSSSSST
jgi:1-acyl-sn-glycerol-3-phosphate acyltransferase